jgi:hypothetical protein
VVTFKVSLITAILSYSLFAPEPATSLYECEQGAIGFVLVSDHEGSPIFWLGRKTNAEVKYEDLICMLPGNHRVMVLSSEEKEM